uniref:Uncharacterized protein n=1 Tax=Reclinomonas americana ATCC 50283 TaxID=1295594 RepID=M4QAG8_RECAM|nr:hypothetical protein [Reclinomonas americana ATCC 50283]
MIKYLIQLVYKTKYQLEKQYLKKLILNIFKLRHEYHLLSEQEFQKLWIKTKEIIKDNGIKKILLNNYLFIIYRSFLGNIGLYYIYKKVNKKKKFNIVIHLLTKYEFIAIQQISIILELYRRLLHKVPSYSDIYLFLTLLNSLSIKQKNIEINNNFNIYIMLFLYNQLLDANYNLIVDKKTKENIFLTEYISWFFQKQSLYINLKNDLDINLHTQKEIILNNLQKINIKNTSNYKQEINIFNTNTYKQLNTKNQQHKTFILKYDSYLYENKTFIEIINHYLLKINPTIKKNLKKDYFFFENINKNKKKNIYKHPFEIHHKPYLKTIQKQDLFLNKQLIWENYKYKKKELKNQIYQQNKFKISSLQFLINSFYTIDNNVFLNPFKKEIDKQNTGKKNKIISCSNIYLQIIILINILKTLNVTNFIIIVETKEFLYLLTKILSKHQFQWHLLMQDNILNIYNLLKNIKINNEKKNILILNSIQLRQNINLFNKNIDPNFITISMELLNQEINNLINKHIYLLFYNISISKYILNQINIQNIYYISKQELSTNIYHLKNIISTNTNNTTFLNKEFLKKTQELYFVQHAYRFLFDLQTISPIHLRIYKNYLKTIYLNNMYLSNHWTFQIKNTYTLNEITKEIINNHYLKKNKKIEFLGIHIQKKKKLNRKEDYKTKIISTYCNKRENNSYAIEQQKLILSFNNLLTVLEKQTHNNNRKTTKNDEYIFLLQIKQIYKNFIYELLIKII